jgi:hypothetical protein
MSDNKTSNGGGIGFAGLLTILFIAFKLAGVIGWSWGWVLSPMWISVLLFLACIALPAVFVGLSFIVIWIIAIFKK